MLKYVPGATPEERRAHLLTAAEPDQAKLDEQLSKAIMNGQRGPVQQAAEHWNPYRG